METIMKLPLAHSHLTDRFHGPLRFGARWRGHELILRLIQVALLLTFAVVGARFVALGIRMLVERLS
jgi:hypothetical protein